MSTRFNCPICNNSSATISGSIPRPGVFCACPTCGRYEIDTGLYTLDNDKIVLKEDLKSSMYFFLTQSRKEQMKNKSLTVRFDKGDPNGPEILEQGSIIFVSREAVLNIFPDNMEDQVSMILVNFRNICEYPGYRFDEIYDMSHLFFLETEVEKSKFSEIDWWLNTLTHLGYITQWLPPFSLTLEGWKRANDYAKAQAKSKTVFVAMSFADELHIAREEIKRAIESSGFVPMLIDTKEHNNQIVPEILYEIRKSRFIVADFTNQRGGVYYEAGYAEGLSIPVLALCRDDDFENVHFDLQQKNTIRWKKPEDIFDKLYKRIEATIN